ncbi:hypothetical protein BKA56DRAFT_219500 [Ilyonectria sp. MPI-CAGE-AT-0026]|nr:hypothetical protein BKA56DRAFT_219500 [Ilyonectria sp. MPI-CAGE-AT-0026]
MPWCHRPQSTVTMSIPSPAMDVDFPIAHGNATTLMLLAGFHLDRPGSDHELDGTRIRTWYGHGLGMLPPRTLAASALHLDKGRLVVPIAGLVPLTDSRHQVFPSLSLGLDPARAALALGPRRRSSVVSSESDPTPKTRNAGLPPLELARGPRCARLSLLALRQDPEAQEHHVRFTCLLGHVEMGNLAGKRAGKSMRLYLYQVTGCDAREAAVYIVWTSAAQCVVACVVTTGAPRTPEELRNANSQLRSRRARQGDIFQ